MTGQAHAAYVTGQAHAAYDPQRHVIADNAQRQCISLPSSTTVRGVLGSVFHRRPGHDEALRRNAGLRPARGARGAAAAKVFERLFGLARPPGDPAPVPGCFSAWRLPSRFACFVLPPPAFFLYSYLAIVFSEPVERVFLDGLALCNQLFKAHTCLTEAGVSALFHAAGLRQICAKRRGLGS